MRTIDTDAQRAEDVLVELARHIPHSVPIGRPTLVTGRSTGCLMQAGPMLVDRSEMVLTAELTVWFLEDGAAVRLIELDNGRRELTRFSRGQEISRQLTPL